MSLSKIVKGLEKVSGRPGLVLRKHSPEILLGVGVVGAIGAAVLACRATLRVEEILDNHTDKMEMINHGWERIENGEIEPELYTEKMYKRDLSVAYLQTGADFVKLYGPAISLGILSLTCILGAHNILSKRNVALVAAYKTLEEGFTAYRKRVVDELGEDKDYMFKNGLYETEVEEIDEKGKKTTKKVVVKGGDGHSVYSRFFDDASTEWSDTAEYNMMFLRSQQNYWNDMLNVRGHVFLNEVYESLGLDHSDAGAITGWVRGSDGDGFIDFGIFNGDNDRVRAFVNGWEPSILLDFNVDGIIWNKI